MVTEQLNVIKRLRVCAAGSSTMDALCLEIGQCMGASVLVIDMEGNTVSVCGTAWNVDTKIPVSVLKRIRVIEEPECKHGSFFRADEDGWSMVLPLYDGATRLGDLVMYRYEEYLEDALVVGEYIALLAASRFVAMQRQNEYNMRLLEERAESSVNRLAVNEFTAMAYILQCMKNSDTVVVSRVAEEINISRSVIIQALRKLEEDGMIECRSSGMRGTRIAVLNPFLKEMVEWPRR